MSFALLPLHAEWRAAGCSSAGWLGPLESPRQKRRKAKDVDPPEESLGLGRYWYCRSLHGPKQRYCGTVVVAEKRRRKCPLPVFPGADVCHYHRRVALGTVSILAKPARRVPSHGDRIGGYPKWLRRHIDEVRIPEQHDLPPLAPIPTLKFKRGKKKDKRPAEFRCDQCTVTYAEHLRSDGGLCVDCTSTVTLRGVGVGSPPGVAAESWPLSKPWFCVPCGRTIETDRCSAGHREPPPPRPSTWVTEDYVVVPIATPRVDPAIRAAHKTIKDVTLADWEHLAGADDIARFRDAMRMLGQRVPYPATRHESLARPRRPKDGARKTEFNPVTRKWERPASGFLKKAAPGELMRWGARLGSHRLDRGMPDRPGCGADTPTSYKKIAGFALSPYMWRKGAKRAKPITVTDPAAFASMAADDPPPALRWRPVTTPLSIFLDGAEGWPDWTLRKAEADAALDEIASGWPIEASPARSFGTAGQRPQEPLSPQLKTWLARVPLDIPEDDERWAVREKVRHWGSLTIAEQRERQAALARVATSYAARAAPSVTGELTLYFHSTAYEIAFSDSTALEHDEARYALWLRWKSPTKKRNDAIRDEQCRHEVNGVRCPNPIGARGVVKRQLCRPCVDHEAQHGVLPNEALIRNRINKAGRHHDPYINPAQGRRPGGGAAA
jgi:hypothetical protein